MLNIHLKTVSCQVSKCVPITVLHSFLDMSKPTSSVSCTVPVTKHVKAMLRPGSPVCKVHQYHLISRTKNTANVTMMKEIVNDIMVSVSKESDENSSNVAL